MPLDRETLSAALAKVLLFSAEHPRRFDETVELQVVLHGIDPIRDRRFSGTVELPHACKPNLLVCVLGCDEHLVEARELGLDTFSASELRFFGKNRKLFKQLRSLFYYYRIARLIHL
uniref:Uncharacterized protein n=1 Tax=Vannella robusta TaxID=1487602 RepID=A0A7S4M958_9EUKA